MFGTSTQFNDLPGWGQFFIALLILLVTGVAGFFGGRNTFYSEIKRLEKDISKLKEYNQKHAPFVGLAEKGLLVRTTVNLIILEDELQKVLDWANSWEEPEYQFSNNPEPIFKQGFMGASQVQSKFQMPEKVGMYLNTQGIPKEKLILGYNLGLAVSKIYSEEMLGFTGRDMTLVKDIYEVFNLVSEINNRTMELETIEQMNGFGARFSTGMSGVGAIVPSEMPFGAKKEEVENLISFAKQQIKLIKLKCSGIPNRIEECREDIEKLIDKMPNQL